MRDAIGNSLDKGAILCWHMDPDNLRRGLIVQVTNVSDGGLSLGATGETVPPSITVQMTIPVNGVKPGQEAMLADFVRLMDPASQRIVEGMLAKEKMQ